MWQRFAVNKNERRITGPELCQLLFPFGTVCIRTSGEESLPFTFEQFQSSFLFFFFALVTDKGNNFNTSEKCLIISSCEILVLLNESMLGMWISIHCGLCLFSFLTKNCYQVVVLVRTSRALASPGHPGPPFILGRQENVIIKSIAFCQMNANPISAFFWW